jgi:hypothetical protein
VTQVFLAEVCGDAAGHDDGVGVLPLDRQVLRAGAPGGGAVLDVEDAGPGCTTPRQLPAGLTRTITVPGRSRCRATVSAEIGRCSVRSSPDRGAGGTSSK